MQIGQEFERAVKKSMTERGNFQRSVWKKRPFFKNGVWEKKMRGQGEGGGWRATDVYAQEKERVSERGDS